MMLTETAEFTLQSMMAGLRLDPKMSVSEWADERRILSAVASAEPGPWETSRTPYLCEPMDCLSASSEIEAVAFMKGAQLGGTEMGNNWIGSIMDITPGPTLFVQPTVELAKRASKQRIAPMIADTPVLAFKVKESKSRDSGNTIMSKEFPGGMLVMTGANSAVGLRSMPARFVFADEVDAYPFDCDGEGDPLKLIKKRTSTYRATRKLLYVSTPNFKGLSRIEALFEASDQRYYFVPCPGCGHYQIIRWGNISWPKKPEPRRDLAYLVCEKCKLHIQEDQKDYMLAHGEWRPTKKGGHKGLRGYHLSALYSPLGWYTWGEAAQEHKDALRDGKESMKTWVNTVLAETYEESGLSADSTMLLQRRELYKAEVPKEVLVLTAGVDVQDDRIEMEVTGWAPGEESWAIDYVIIQGRPDKIHVWKKLKEALEAVYSHESGINLRISSACIDSAGHFTDHVYKFCKGKESRRWYAIVGRQGGGRPIAAPAKRRRGRARIPVHLWIVGVDAAKRMVMHRLEEEKVGPGYSHFPDTGVFHQEYFRQLTAEKLETKIVRGFPVQRWVKTRERNEALDCRVYSMAALYILNPKWISVKAKVDKRVKAIAKKPEEVLAEVAEEALSQKPHRTRRLKKRGSRGSFVNKYGRPR